MSRIVSLALIPLAISVVSGRTSTAREVRLKADTTEVRLRADATRQPVVSGFSRTMTQAAQPSFDAAISDLKSPDRDTRLRAVRLLKDAGRPEAALPLVALLSDADDEIQYEAIGAELNIFLAEKVVSKRRVGLDLRGAQPCAGRSRVLGRPARARRASGAARNC